MPFRPIKNQPTKTTTGFRSIEKPITSSQQTSTLKRALGTVKGATIGIVETFGKGAEEVLKGAGKGLLETSVQASGLVEKGLKAVLPKRAEEFLRFDEETVAEQLIPKEVRTAEGILQQVGFYGEQIGEFFLPVGKIREARILLKGSKFIAGLAKGGKTARIASRVLPRLIPEIAGDLSVAIVQGADPSELVTIATINAGIPIGGELIGKATAPIKKVLTERIAPNFLNRIIKPLEKAFRFGKDPGRGVVSEGIIGNTRGGLLKNISNKLNNLSGQLDDVLVESTRTANIKRKILDPIQNAIKDATSAGEQTLVSRLIDLQDGLTKKFRVVNGRLIERGTKNLTSVNANGITRIKREIGKATRWTGQAFDDDVNKVRVAIYRNLDKTADNLAPASKELNSRIANLIGAKTMLQRSNNIRIRQNAFRLLEAGTGLGVGLGTFLGGEKDLSSAIQSIGIGIATATGAKVVRSPAVQTRIARTISKLGTQERNILTRSVPILRRIFVESQIEK